MALATEVEALYPPDWSDRDVVRLRVSGYSEPFAEVRTASPEELEVQFAVEQAVKARDVADRLRISARREGETGMLTVLVKGADSVRQAGFRELFISSAKAFSMRPR